ncbi:MAG: hypothetical protein QXL15_03070 [Candidatus Korarchaeota archaeon]
MSTDVISKFGEVIDRIENLNQLLLTISEDIKKLSMEMISSNEKIVSGLNQLITTLSENNNSVKELIISQLKTIENTVNDVLSRLGISDVVKKVEEMNTTFDKVKREFPVEKIETLLNTITTMLNSLEEGAHAGK